MTRSARQVYRDDLVRRMVADDRVLCLDSDTGLFAGIDFGTAARRYLNLGIAEQNLMSVAAGLAADGWTPFVNTMASFAATRALEAVKIDIAYNNLPVRIVGTHGGLSAGHFGPTHQSLEDLAVMRALPNMTVVVPGDTNALLHLLDQIEEVPGPVYLRLGRKAEPRLPDGRAALLGRLQPMRDGAQVVIVCTGALPVRHSLAAAALLARDGIDVGVVQAHTLKPFDTATLLERVARASLVVTVEEHWRTGGLGSIVAETLAENLPREVLRMGLPDAFTTTVGSQVELFDRAGLTAPHIASVVRQAWRRREPKGERCDRVSGVRR